MIRLINVASLYSSLYEAVEFCKKHDGEKIEIVVPDKLSLFMEKFLFEQLNLSASFNIKISTLNRFSKKNCVVDKSAQISKVGSILLIYKILNENIDKFSVFSSKAYSFTYAENIFRTIGQLKASKIEYNEMLKFNSSDELLNKKIADLALVYELYENGKAGLLDASDLFLLSTFSVAEGRNNAKILFVGFDDFTAIEYSIIERLACVCEVNVFNYYSKATNKYIYNSEVYSQLKRIAYVNDLDFKVEEVCVETKGLKGFLQENLFATKKDEICLKDELLKIVSAKDANDEIELVARDIRYKILNGQKYGDFGVAVYGLENYQTKIKEVFEKYEINYYLDGEMLLNKSIFYKFICNILKFNLEGYSLTSFVDLINSPFFEMPMVDKVRLINKLITIGFKGKVKNDFDLGEGFEEISEQTKKFIIPLIFEQDKKVEEFIKDFNSFCVDFNIDFVLENLVDIVSIQDKVLIKKSKDVIFNLFNDVLQFNPNINLESFYDIFMHVSSVVKIQNLPLTIDAVKVVDANNTMEIFNDLYIVNCTIENAPNLKFDCGIILDNEIEKLNFSHKLSPTISHINRLSRLRLYNSVLMFEKNLVITYSKNPSDLIKEISQKLYVNHNGNKLKLVPITQLNFGKYRALSYWDYVMYICENGVSNKENLKNIIKNKDFSQISNKNLNVFENFKTVSASQLENYFKCPFYMFLQNILKIKPRIENEILAFDIGNVLHEIMFRYYKCNKQVGDIYNFCKNQVFNFVDKDDRLKLNINSPILTNLIDEAVRVINGVNYLDDNSKFVPYKFEYEFNNNAALRLKNIDIIGKVDRVDVCNDMLRVIDYKSGKIDASLKELYYGYKLQLFLYSCAVEDQLKKKIIGGFYLPLHNKFTRTNENTYALKGYYLNEDFVISALDNRINAGEKSDIVNMRLTKDGKAYGMPNDGQMEGLKTYSKRIVEKAVDEIRSGYIKPSPMSDSVNCEHCVYSQVCLKNCANIQDRKAKSVNLTSFEEVDNA